MFAAEKSGIASGFAVPSSPPLALFRSGMMICRARRVVRAENRDERVVGGIRIAVLRALASVVVGRLRRRVVADLICDVVVARLPLVVVSTCLMAATICSVTPAKAPASAGRMQSAHPGLPRPRTRSRARRGWESHNLRAVVAATTAGGNERESGDQQPECSQDTPLHSQPVLLRRFIRSHTGSTAGVSRVSDLSAPCASAVRRSAGGGGRTHTSRRTRDFESRASASSATPAERIVARPRAVALRS